MTYQLRGFYSNKRKGTNFLRVGEILGFTIFVFFFNVWSKWFDFSHLRSSTYHVKWEVLSSSHLASSLISHTSFVLLFKSFVSEWLSDTGLRKKKVRLLSLYTRPLQNGAVTFSKRDKFWLQLGWDDIDFFAIFSTP